MKENKIIAEFMGLGIQLDMVEHIESGEYIHCEEMEFHTSWDWLMPVVEKIKDIPTYEGYDSIDFVLNCDLTIENLYNSVVEFIKEYNK